MKRLFLVEIEYNELDSNVKDNSPVLGEVGVEIALENYMKGYDDTGSIKGEYSVTVNEVDL